ncbi:SufD family Fe-S cluster assembly protein [Candidatus Xianfuyuplasma coldseepsis]|uniref:SufD family Fe-S cluster assembly protein n=1 Tax=Candidatus Xianfuyuplasma coldseepsis TaxID=2782163 RepID=A0A7L7KQF1_9MOLU|nr:SufD family Fe-S cluster assembly protein [Xianfuyuplasma coldseepsis]QMS84446.1 SufD family Fe-S cluster assembly protein [Xianfuyuplasma coldseepsis]
MKSFEIKPLKDNVIPGHIQDLLVDDLTNYIIIKDGHILTKELSSAFDEVLIESYEHALPEYINHFLDTEFVNDFAADDAVYDYNINHVNSGLLIHVPKNTYVEERLHVFYIQADGDLVHNTRLILEPNAELSYFEYLYNESASNINFVTNSIVKENASLQYSGISNLDENATCDIRRNSYVSRYGKSHYSVAEVNDGDIDNNTNIFLQEKYASGTSKTVAITSNNQAAIYKQMIEHNAPETEGYIENYGVSNHASQLTFEGVGKINKNMKRSVARQSNRGIVLGNDSRLDANPLLLIDEYDVEASHGAAIGKIDEEQLYYLMSRGLTLKVAERLIISGFLSPVLRILSTDALRNDFIQKVEVKTS